MTRALILAAVSTLSLAVPALAQDAGRATATPSSPAAASPTDPSCPPEHAALGHCTLKTNPPLSQPPAAPAAPVDPSCPPEHAAMGHCAPKSAMPADQRPSPAPAPAAPAAVTDPSCPPEHAAMGHCTPKVTPPAASAPEEAPASVDPSCPPEHAAMGHCTPKTAAAPAGGPQASSVAPPVAPPPPAALSGPEHAADTVWDPKLMARKRAAIINEHGGYRGYMLLLDRSEYRVVEGRDGYAWDWEGWYGGDYDRLWVKSEGEGEFGDAIEQAEVQALFSRALDPWFNVQAGVRYDIRPKPDRAHLVVGIQGLVPYWFEVEGGLFLSDKGDVTARFEAEYDQRITNRLILQPRVEFDLAAQDVPELGIGAGLSSVEAGVRLRYEIKREIAPYVGVNYERRLGDSADFVRAAGEDPGGWAVVLGLRSWF